MCQALGRGVTRSKRLAMQCCRKAADNGHTYSCQRLASSMYGRGVIENKHSTDVAFQRTESARAYEQSP
jgi:TPR repeat protein